MNDMTRKEAIEVLKDIVSKPMLYSNFIMGACRVALASLETDEAYQLEYERTTKNDHHRQNIQAYAQDFGVSEEQAEKELRVITKNDLGVDCISRQAVIDMTGLSEWFDSSDSYIEFVFALSELPSVTPQEPTIDYRRAFKIACELLSGSVLYGIDTDKIFETAMQKDGLVSNESYERYILNHLQELDHGQYAGVEE